MIARRIYPIKYNGVFVKGRVQRKKVWKIRGWGGAKRVDEFYCNFLGFLQTRSNKENTLAKS